jgi:hypothetical protein
MRTQERMEKYTYGAMIVELHKTQESENTASEESGCQENNALRKRDIKWPQMAS